MSPDPTLKYDKFLCNFTFAVGSQHASFSDFLVLPLVRRAAATRLMDVSGQLVVSFLDGNLDQCLKDIPTRDMEVKVIGVKKDGKPKRKLVGNVGEVIVL